MLQVNHLAIEPVVFLVADGRLRQHIIGMIVLADLFDQFGIHLAQPDEAV